MEKKTETAANIVTLKNKDPKTGRFLPGKSGNPSGRAQHRYYIEETQEWISAGEMFRRDVPEVARRLLERIRDPETPAAPFVAACKEWFDRGFGRPHQSVTMTEKPEDQSGDLVSLPPEMLKQLLAIADHKTADEAEGDDGE